MQSIFRGQQIRYPKLYLTFQHVRDVRDPYSILQFTLSHLLFSSILKLLWLMILHSSVNSKIQYEYDNFHNDKCKIQSYKRVSNSNASEKEAVKGLLRWRTFLLLPLHTFGINDIMMDASSDAVGDVLAGWCKLHGA